MPESDFFPVHIRKALLLLICSFSLAHISMAEHIFSGELMVRDSDTVVVRRKVIKVIQRDFPDLIRSLAGRKVILKSDSAVAASRNKPEYAIAPAVGYTLSTGLTLIVAANIAFYTNRTDHSRQSTIQMSGVYTQYNQITTPLLSSIWSKNNKYNFIGDWRYFKYPQATYGLGGYSSMREANKIDYSYLRFYQSVLRQVYTNLTLGGGYNLDRHWNITQQALNGTRTADPTRYGLGKTSTSSGLVFLVQHDTRKNIFNPVAGSHFTNMIYKHNFTVLGSNSNWQSLLIDLRKYIGISARGSQILALWSYSSLTLRGNPPYLDLPSTGWDANNNTGRGYIQSRFRGKNMLYLESEYRFVASRNGLFGGVLFTNAESFSEWPSNRFEKIAIGAGAGIRMKVNKHSNTNIAIDYGFGSGGSHGMFVNLGELF